MSPPQISLHELYRMQQNKTHARTVCFDRVLELCHRRIRTVASYGGQNTFFEIPGMMIGYPLYNIYDCLDYIVSNMRKTGFLVQVLPPPSVCVIYISWDPSELHPTNKSKQSKPKSIKSSQANKPLLRLF